MTAANAPAKRAGPRPANARGASRLAAVQALYQMELGGTSIEEVLAEFETWRLGQELDGDTYREADAAFFRDLVRGVVADQRELDARIHENLVDGWPLARLDVTLRSILRAAAWELASKRDVPARVVITEFVDVAKAFFGNEEPKMVNGVLDTLARSYRPGEFEGPAAVRPAR
ncbi:MAG: transcription antitermination factor NusB [Bauldia sp.]|nr:transcription antitermination factor NusB [Bauldia sp.]